MVARKKTTRKKKTGLRKKSPLKRSRAKSGPKRVYRKKDQKSTGLTVSAFFIALGLVCLVFAVMHVRNLKSEVRVHEKKETPKKEEKVVATKKAPLPDASKVVKTTLKKAITPEPKEQPQAIVYEKVVTVKKETEVKQPQAIVYDEVISPPKKSKAILSGKPKMVFLIDDIGYHLEHEELLADLGDDIVYAILPLLPYSGYFSNLGYRKGADIILHLPLQTINGTIPGRGLITDQMSEDQIRDQLSRNLASVPYHMGANNHMGSLGTSNPYVMQAVLKEIKRRNLFFIDSVTTSKSVAFSIAREFGVRSMKRDIFLDNIDETPAIRKQVLKQSHIARDQGYAIGIGHYRGTTLSVLKEMIPELRAEGFEVVSLTELMSYLKI